MHVRFQGPTRELRRLALTLLVAFGALGCDSTPIGGGGLDATAVDAVTADAITVDTVTVDTVTADAVTVDAVTADAPGPDASCATGQRLCGGRCTDTAIDPANCGACGAVCVLPNAAANGCAAGACAVLRCSAGFGDCDGTASNGCETNTQSTLTSCGSCGRTCTLPNATATCTAGACAVASCATGYADCDRNAANGCEADTRSDNANCGACARACAAGTMCSGGACGVTCLPPQVNCGGACANLAIDPMNCGSCGAACASANALAFCAARACGFVCAAGFGDCDGSPTNGCETATTSSTAHCGACGRACAPANAAGTCVAGACGVASCSAGFGDCDGMAATGCEVALNTNRHCGACDRACTGDQTCTGGTCQCPPGQRAVGTACVTEGAAPRPVAPMSLGDVTQRRPTLRWALPNGFDGAVVELCRDRACTMVLETLTVSGSSARPVGDLPARSVVFWRIRGRAGATTDTRYSPTWLFHVPAVSASSGVDTSFNAHFDVNGDGYDDLVVGAVGADPGGRSRAGAASVFHGSMSGVGRVAARVLAGSVANDYFGSSVASAGDVNGDGYADLVVGAPFASPGGRSVAGAASVFHGGVSGVAAVAARVLEGSTQGFGFGDSVASAGDVDGDGYADIVVGAAYADPGGRRDAGTASVFHGSASGVTTTPSRVFEGGAPNDNFGISVASLGEVQVPWCVAPRGAT